MSKRRVQVTNEAVSLFIDYNKMKNPSQNNFVDNSVKSFSCSLWQTIQSETVIKMVEKLNHDKIKIPLEILGLNQYYQFNCYNFVQSQCLLQLMFADHNVLICAPTATGKTSIMEMAIFRELGLRNTQSFKMLYLAPIRALCQQKVEEWSARFSSLNVTVSELTGDADFSTKNKCIKGAHLIVATPEKWDSYTRKQKNVSEALSGYSLLLLDEVHCVGDLERGAILECVVSRLKTFTSLFKSKQKLRIIAVSATLPNIEDIAIWLNVRKDQGLLTFKESDRPVPLEKHVLSFNCENQYSFENYLNFRLLGVIERYSEDKPTLVFCQTQKGTQLACQSLLQQGKSNQFIRDDSHAERLLKTAQSVMDQTLANFIKQGIAFHNANLIPQDRIIVEKLFTANDLIVICTTTTLALGVNLPAHLVVIKSTLCYRGSKLNYQEYSLYELCQMMGRAGRPQFDTKGVVVIMTETKKYQFYQSIFEEHNGEQKIEQPPLESYLADSIPTLINAEIGIGYISTLESVMNFIRNTYYYVRQMVKQQTMFENAQDFQNHVDKMILEKCSEAIEKLSKLNLINYDSKAKTMESTLFGKELARQSLEVSTIDILYLHNQNQNKTGLTIYSVQDILGITVQAQEFQDCKSKQNERTELNRFNKIIKWKLKGAINTPQKKIYVFLQAHIANIQMEWELRKQASDIVLMSIRVLKCFRKFFQIKLIASGLLSCVKLQSYIENKAWPDDPKQVFSQLQGVGDKTSADMIKNGFKNLESLSALTTPMLSDSLKKNIGFAEAILNQISSQPTILTIRVESLSSNQFELVVTFKIKDHQNTDNQQNQDGCLIILSEGEKLLHQKFQNSSELRYKYKNELNDVFFQLKLSLVNTKFVGMNEFHQLKVKSMNGKSELIESKRVKTDEVYSTASNIDFEVEHVKQQILLDQVTLSASFQHKAQQNENKQEQLIVAKQSQIILQQQQQQQQQQKRSVLDSIFGMDTDFSFTAKIESINNTEGYDDLDQDNQKSSTSIQEFSITPMIQNRRENQKCQPSQSMFLNNLYKKDNKFPERQETQSTIQHKQENYLNKGSSLANQQKSLITNNQNPQPIRPQQKPQQYFDPIILKPKKRVDVILESNKKVELFLSTQMVQSKQNASQKAKLIQSPFQNILQDISSETLNQSNSYIFQDKSLDRYGQNGKVLSLNSQMLNNNYNDLKELRIKTTNNEIKKSDITNSCNNVIKNLNIYTQPYKKVETVVNFNRENIEDQDENHQFINLNRDIKSNNHSNQNKSLNNIPKQQQLIGTPPRMYSKKQIWQNNQLQPMYESESFLQQQINDTQRQNPYQQNDNKEQQQQIQQYQMQNLQMQFQPQQQQQQQYKFQFQQQQQQQQLYLFQQQQWQFQQQQLFQQMFNQPMPFQQYNNTYQQQMACFNPQYNNQQMYVQHQQNDFQIQNEDDFFDYEKNQGKDVSDNDSNYQTHPSKRYKNRYYSEETTDQMKDRQS